MGRPYYDDPVEMWLWSSTKPIHVVRLSTVTLPDWFPGTVTLASASVGAGGHSSAGSLNRPAGYTGYVSYMKRFNFTANLESIDDRSGANVNADIGDQIAADDEDDDGSLALHNYWALLAIILVFGTAAGNILVCLAIVWERRLQNVTNYFLMSLAITDLMVALSVMPLGILTLVKDYMNPNRLMYATVRTVSINKCRDTYKVLADNLGIEGARLINEQYCAVGSLVESANEYGDACQGDSGGPLQVKQSNDVFLVGVITSGVGCGSSLPGLYARVASYFDWINATITGSA